MDLSEIDCSEHPSLPLDVVQIVLGYVQDTRSVAAARQACKAWLKAAAAAPCTVQVSLPSNIQGMKQKLDLLYQIMPGLAGFLITVGSAPEPTFTQNTLQILQSFTSLKQLELSFSDSVELEAPDLSQLATLTGLTSLGLHNASLPAGTDSSGLTQLQNLLELNLVHNSKVSALMTGDTHLKVIGRLSGLTQLVLQGRICSATDDGLAALTGLSRLASLAISWVPWQSQISQRAALQLLSSLKSLRSLQLGGAELLLPSAPYHPLAAPTGAPTPAGLENNNPHNMLNINVVGQQQGSLIAAAVAEVSRVERPRGGGRSVSAAAAVTQSALQGEYMRKVLAGRAEGLDTFKLQFNCCGTGVEKALLSIGDVRKKLTGLQWSYAKLTGPTSVSLLASCTSLRSLKLRLWYQDYNLTPFEFKLMDLAPLSNLRTLVIDKRPPFQQQLPAQQAAVTLPVTAPVLSKLADAWPNLEKLQLGLARSDFGSHPLQGLTGFTNLKSLSVHCYDQGYDDGHFMLPIDVASLPSGLIKLDLMHAELFSSNLDTSNLARSASTAAASSSSSIRCQVASSSSKSCKAGSSCNSRTGGFAAASAFTSMLSESFSLLSRQASAECSAAYLDRHTTLRDSSPAAAGAASAARMSCLPSAASGKLAGSVSKGLVNSCRGKTLARSASVEPSDSWLRDLLHDSSSRAAAGRDQGANRSSRASNLARQPSLPPLPKQHSVTPKTVAKIPAAVSTCCGTVAAAAAASRDAVASSKADQQQRPAAAAIPAAVAPKPSRLQNPFAAAAAAAAVHAEMGGCVTAVDPSIAAAAAAAVAAEHPHVVGLEPMLTAPVGAATAATYSHHAASKHRSSIRSSSSLTKSFSLNLSKHFGKSSKASAASVQDAGQAGACAADVERVPCLPQLQHLQLKHCALDGCCMDDIIGSPAELRSFQLVEVCGLTPRDVAMLPMLTSLQRLTVIAAKEDSWLGLAPLRLLSKLPELRHLDWVVSERALPSRSKATDLQQLAHFSKLQVITLHTVLGKCEQLHAVSSQLPAGCHVRLMSPAYCEHASRRSGSKLGKLLKAASCLIPGTGNGHSH